MPCSGAGLPFHSGKISIAFTRNFTSAGAQIQRVAMGKAPPEKQQNSPPNYSVAALKREMLIRW